MVERTLVITGRLGLHARAAAKVVRLARRFESEVLLRRADRDVTADAKSILSVLMLAAGRGMQLQASAEGVDEDLAIAAIEELFASGFGELEAEASI